MATRISAIVGWIGTALVVVALALRFLKPEWDQYRTYAAWAGLAFILVYLLAQWRESATGANARQTRMGTMSVVSVLAMLAILAAINYLGVRQNKRWDLTANQIFSLSDQTLKVIQGLDAPAKITVFDQAANFDRFKDRLEEYQYQNKQLSLEYVDIDRQPALAKAANVTQPGTMVLEYKGRVERITQLDEQDITNAFIKATTGEERKVYFTQGHGEKDPAATDRLGYSGVADALKGDNYAFEKLVLAQSPAVPDGATAVVVAGPVTDFFPAEIDALKAYLDKGGKLMVMLDPPDKPGAPTLPNLTGFLKTWGIEVGDDVVVDASGVGQIFGAGPTVPVAASYPTHAITDRFNLMTAFPLARSLTTTPADGHTAQAFVETSPRSWAEKDVASLSSGTEVSLDESKGDRQGPIVLAAAVSAPLPGQPATPPAPVPTDTPEPPKPETRVVVYGDSDFAANYGLGIQGNRDLFMNSLGWLSQQEGLIAVRARSPEDRRLTMTADQLNRMMILSIFLIPATVFGLGIYTWWRRR
ncbi:MAG: Gldg family protein [Vicinamibacterales bacterium]